MSGIAKPLNVFFALPPLNLLSPRQRFANIQASNRTKPCQPLLVSLLCPSPALPGLLGVFLSPIFQSICQMVAPGWNLNHAKLRSLEDERDVLLIQEKLLADLRASMAPLERLAIAGRGTEDLDGASVTCL